MIEKLTSTKGIALLLSALIVGMLAGPAAAAIVGEQTVEITDPDGQEIEATVELVDDPVASNTTVELQDDTGTVVQSVDLNGTVGTNITESFTVSSAGNYTVSVTADNSANATVHTVNVVQSSSMTGLFGSQSKSQQWAMFGGIGLVVAAGAYLLREEDNGY